MNWQWPTLERILQGGVPKAALVARATRTTPRLWEIELANHGDADAELRVALTAEWCGAQRVASDALDGFEGRTTTSNTFRLVADEHTRSSRLPPGQRRMAGWLRLSEDTEVELHVSLLESSH